MGVASQMAKGICLQKTQKYDKIGKMVDVCFVLDDGYAMPTCVAMTSLLENKSKATLYRCFVLGKNISKANINKIMQLNRDDFQVVFVDLNKYKKDFSKYRIDNISATSTSVFKLCLPDILDDLDRVVYLDGDTIIQGDLSDLYNCEFNGCYVAAVKDFIAQIIKTPKHHYFNSGVMVLNLTKMREDDVAAKLLDYREHGVNFLMDQDTLNYVCDSPKLLPFCYNTQMNAINNAIDRENFSFMLLQKYWDLPASYNNIDRILNDAVVVHYATSKPWKYFDLLGGDLWLQYYVRSPYGHDSIVRDRKLKINQTTSFKIGKIMLFPMIKIKRIVDKTKTRGLKKFLENFLTNG